MENIVGALAGFVILILILIVVHELGHLLVARACGVGVESFTFGFGPGFKAFTLRGIPFYFRLIPLYGAVELKSREIPNCKSAGKYREDAPSWQKILIFSAGIGFNLLLAVALQTSMYWFAPDGVQIQIFAAKITFLPLKAAWYLAPLYAAKTVLMLFAAWFVVLLTSILFSVLPIVKMAPIANGGLIGMMSLGANAQSGFWSFCGLVYFVSIIAAALQLLPCWPLDGGHIATALVRRVFNEGRVFRILSAVIKWAGVVLLVIIIINMAMSDLSGAYRYFIK